MSVTIGIILIIVLLFLSLIPNYNAMKQAKSQGSKSTRFTVMVGIDAILIVLLVFTIILNNYLIKRNLRKGSFLFLYWSITL